MKGKIVEKREMNEWGEDWVTGWMSRWNAEV